VITEEYYTEYISNDLSNVLNSLDEDFYITDELGKLKSIYGCQFKRTGLNKDEYIDKLITEIFKTDTKQLHYNSHQRCLAGESFAYEWELTLNSKIFSYQTSLSPIINNSKVTGVAGIIRNVSSEKTLDRIRSEIALMFKTLTNAAKSSIISLNELGEIEYCNPATTKLFNYELDQLLGKSFYILLAKESQKEFLEKSKFQFDKKYIENDVIEFNGIKKNGDIIPIELSISSYEILHIIHYVILIKDISERKKNEEERRKYQENLENKNKDLEKAVLYSQKMQNQLVQSEKMASLGALIAGIAHEINNPLAYVSSNLNRFQEYFVDITKLLDMWKNYYNTNNGSIKNKKQLREILNYEKEIDLDFITKDFSNLLINNQEGIGRIKSIVLQLRGFSHVSEDNLIEVDINKAIEETITIVWNELKYKANIIKNLGKLPLVKCNVNEIKQIFVNILVNAAQAIKSKGDITIETTTFNEFVKIEISDTGKGMSEEVQRKIFDPFYTTKPVGEGTGLGLWICSSIAQKHNGSFEVKSKPGKGSIFSLTLPLRQKILK